MKNRIFSIDNPKAVKAQEFGYLNAIHYMAPHSLAGVGNLCPHASPGCTDGCLGQYSGAAVYYSSVLQSRIDKAKRFMKSRASYMADIVKAIKAAQSKARKAGLQLCVRLNGSTDIAWESIKDGQGLTIIERFKNVQFVDYTKSPKRALAYAEGRFPGNYALCFSRSESNESDCLKVLKAGGTVAVVFESKPDSWLGFPVADGDSHDLRHLDLPGHVIALSPKGHKAKRDSSGFVVRQAKAKLARPIALATQYEGVAA